MPVPGMDIDRWLCLIKAEYREMPGMSLTPQQAQRLWGLDPETCDTLIAALEADRFLRRTDQNAYVLADAGR